MLQVVEDTEWGGKYQEDGCGGQNDVRKQEEDISNT